MSLSYLTLSELKLLADTEAVVLGKLEHTSG